MNAYGNVQSPRLVAVQKYKIARQNLLLMIILTVLNVVVLAAGSNIMMLFSATIPYLAVAMGLAVSDSILMLICICIAVVAIAVYLLCWLLSKKHYGWMLAAMVLFIIDTVVMIGMYLIAQDFSGIFDILIHAWVLYYLIVGVRYGGRLKKLPDEEAVVSEYGNAVSDADSTVPEAGNAVSGADSTVPEAGNAVSGADSTVSEAGNDVSDDGNTVSGDRQD